MSVSDVVAYEVTVRQGHSCSYIVHAPTPEEAERIARKRWDDGDRHGVGAMSLPLQTSSTPARREPNYDNAERYGECICPVLVGRRVDPQPWCAIHG